MVRGDIVVLKSGSPEMTVQKVVEGSGDKLIYVEWHNPITGRFENTNFFESQLKLLEKKK